MKEKPATEKTPEPPAGPEIDRWLQRATRQTLAELYLFAATTWKIATRPYRFVRAWAAGRTRALNPLGFVATAAALYWFLFGIIVFLWPLRHDTGWFGDPFTQISTALGPYLQYGLLGLLVHSGLRLTGSRGSLQGSLGVAFFAGGIGALGGLLTLTGSRILAHLQGVDHYLPASADHPGSLLLGLVAVGFYLYFCFLLLRGLQALHGVTWYRILPLLAAAVLLSALLFGNVLPKGTYGNHPRILLVFEEGRLENVRVGFVE